MQLTLMISTLRRGVALDKASSLLTVLGLGLTLAPLFGWPHYEPHYESHYESHYGWLALSGLLLLLLGIGEKYWALRVALDVDLFSALAKSQDIEQGLGELDSALQQLGLAPRSSLQQLAPRSLLSRSQGALRLLRNQAWCLGGQVILLLGISIAGCLQAFY